MVRSLFLNVDRMSSPSISDGHGLGLAEVGVRGHVADASSMLENEANELNIGFVARMTRQRPWLRLKIAASL